MQTDGRVLIKSQWVWTVAYPNAAIRKRCDLLIRFLEDASARHSVVLGGVPWCLAIFIARVSPRAGVRLQLATWAVARR